MQRHIQIFRHIANQKHFLNPPQHCTAMIMWLVAARQNWRLLVAGLMTLPDSCWAAPSVILLTIASWDPTQGKCGKCKNCMINGDSVQIRIINANSKPTSRFLSGTSPWRDQWAVSSSSAAGELQLTASSPNASGMLDWIARMAGARWMVAAEN